MKVGEVQPATPASRHGFHPALGCCFGTSSTQKGAHGLVDQAVALLQWIKGRMVLGGLLPTDLGTPARGRSGSLSTQHRFGAQDSPQGASLARTEGYTCPQHVWQQCQRLTVNRG